MPTPQPNGDVPDLAGSDSTDQLTGLSRIDVTWRTLALAEKNPGYAATARPLDDLVCAAAKRVSWRRPVLVWIGDGRDVRSRATIQSRILSQEKTALTLQRFVCLRGDVRTIPDERMRKAARRRAPVFFFFDPKGESAGTLEGKQAESRAAFSARLRKVWTHCYTMPRAVYLLRRDEILDEVQSIDARLGILRARISSAADNPGKLAALRRENDQVGDRRLEIKKRERTLLEGTDLRPELIAAVAADADDTAGSSAEPRFGCARR